MGRLPLIVRFFVFQAFGVLPLDAQIANRNSHDFKSKLFEIQIAEVLARSQPKSPLNPQTREHTSQRKSELGVSEMASAKKGVRNRCPYRGCRVDAEIPYRLPFWREFCRILQVRVASGVDTEFPYRVRIVDRGLIAATLFADTVSSDSQNNPKGPKIEKIQDCPPGLKFSSEIDNFQASRPPNPFFVGNYEGQD